MYHGIKVEHKKYNLFVGNSLGHNFDRYVALCGHRRSRQSSEARVRFSRLVIISCHGRSPVIAIHPQMFYRYCTNILC